MNEQELVVTALPYSADPTPPASQNPRHFHVSLFFTHHLSDDGHVGDYDMISRWIEILRTADIGLRVGSGTGDGTRIKATPLLDLLSDKTWSAVFPEDLAVRAWRTPDLTATPWRSFAAHRMQAYGLIGHALSIKANPVDAPMPSASKLVAAVLDEMRGLEGLGRLLPGDRPTTMAPQPDPTRLLKALAHPDADFDARFTQALRAGVEGSAAPSHPDSPMLTVLQDLELARRYYEREVEQREYHPKPLANAHTPRPTAPEFDFHQRASAVGGLPPLLRQLGLVIDIYVDDPSVFLDRQWIRADVRIEGFLPIAPRTRCKVTGTRFTARGDDSDWRDAALRVGDPSRFVLQTLDPDATALKLERFLRTSARLTAAEQNGEPVNAAPATLRSTGLSLARAGRSQQVRQRVSAAANLATADLGAEQVTRGLRLEVFDDVSKSWHSLHQRLLTVTVDGVGVVVEPTLDEGYLQGAALTRSELPGQPPTGDYYVHETVAGWDGWSLSAPRPGRILVHTEDGSERTLDEAEEFGKQPVNATSVVAPGTLPRLRYGRTYRMRAWAVDLAGNSPRHDARTFSTGQAVAGTPQLITEVVLKALSGDGATASVEPVEDVGPLLKELKAQAPQLHAMVEALYAQASSAPVTSARAAAVRQAFDGVPAAHLLHRTGAPISDDTVTSAQTFLRWEPVLEPTLVPRHPYSEGESLATMVIRSGVGSDGEVVAPDEFAQGNPGWHPQCERHLLAPKTSQQECELHGLFDDAIGTSDTAARQKTLALLRKESGTLFDLQVPDIGGGGFIKQKVRLVDSPIAGSKPTVDLDDITDHHQDLDASRTARESRAKVAAGQYVTIDADEVVIPYLPDPMAGGVSLRFAGAGWGHLPPAPALLEGVQADYPGAWPLPQPFRLVLRHADELSAKIHGNVIDVGLPPGRRLRLKLASSIPPNMLERNGLWHSLASDLADNPEVARAAADGWFWWLSPGTDLQLVHAVPRPVAVPRIVNLVASRPPATSHAYLWAGVTVDGPSTERLDVEAAWTEYVDDLDPMGVVTTATTTSPCSFPVGYHADLVVMGNGFTADPSGPAPLVFREARHDFGDTKHRRVTYTMRATTRYREYFGADMSAATDDLSVSSEPVTVSVPASAAPAPPVVRDVLPLFRWQETTEPAQPFGVRRTRRSGVRLLLERPWFSSGEGELLAVLVSVPGSGAATDDSVSHWAGDPVFKQRGPKHQRLLPLMDPAHLFGVDDRRDAASPVGPPRPVRLPALGADGKPAPDAGQRVLAVGYEPAWDVERGCWVVDVAMDPGTAYWPFVQLRIVRYQPDSLPGLELSQVVRCDPVQIAPRRFTTVTRPDVHSVRVAVTGPVGIPDWPTPRLSVAAPPMANLSPTHNVRARLERFDEAVGTDLAWQTVAVTDLNPIPDDSTYEVTWMGRLEIPRALALEGLDPQRPGGHELWRVTVEEWERMQSDPDEKTGETRWHARMVYAEQIGL